MTLGHTLIVRLYDTNNNVFSFNQQTKFMPRPPSEITGSRVQIHARVTQRLKDEFQSLGGAIWLRKYLFDSMEKKRRDAEQKK